jgi:hypothetical protein
MVEQAAINKIGKNDLTSPDAISKDDGIRHLAADRWSAHGDSGSPHRINADQGNMITTTDLSSLGFPSPKLGETPYDPANPSPETWKYDSKGHLLSAGNRVSAEYDAQGNLKKATIDGSTFERTGDTVSETTVGSDGKSHTWKMDGITKFDLTTKDGDFEGKFKNVDLEALTKNGSGWLEGASVWESAENRANFVKDQERWQKEQAEREAQKLKGWPVNFPAQ